MKKTPHPRLPAGKEQVRWSLTSLVLVIARLLEPSSELYISEQWYHKTVLPELAGVPQDRMDDNRLYRALDDLLPHKVALEVHLKNRVSERFDIEYDLLLYDVTSTFFPTRPSNGRPLLCWPSCRLPSSNLVNLLMRDLEK